MDSTNNSNSITITSGSIDTDVCSDDTIIIGNLDSSNLVTIDLSGWAAQQTMLYSSNIDLNSDVTLNNITFDNINWDFNSAPFENCFPEWDDFKKMCDEYPGLEKTLEHLKAYYKLCKDDWEAKKRGDSE